MIDDVRMPCGGEQLATYVYRPEMTQDAADLVAQQIVKGTNGICVKTLRRQRWDDSPIPLAVIEMSTTSAQRLFADGESLRSSHRLIGNGQRLSPRSGGPE